MTKGKLIIYSAVIMACLVIGHSSYAVHNCEWTINKKADQSVLNLSIGQSFMVNYTVTVNGVSGTGTLPCYGEVWDTNLVDSSPPNGYLGSFWQWQVNPKTFTYPATIGPYEQCGDYQVPNSALLHLGYPYMDIVGPQDSWIVTVHIPCEGGCTLTQGYWKTHSSYGPAPYDDTWAHIGEDTNFFTSGNTWYKILWIPPAGNPYYILAHQYIAAYLNRLKKTDASAVTSALADAEILLNTYSPSDLLSKDIKDAFRATAFTLDLFNSGTTGPGHCSE